MEWPFGLRARQTAIALAAMARFAALPNATARSAICPCAIVDLWHGAVPSPERSQHLLNWWTFSHVTQG